MQLCLRLVLFSSVMLTAFSATAQNWAERVKFSNDFRFRTEYVETTNSSAHPQLRQRMRARVGFGYDVNEEFATTFKLASGSTDPISSNETFDGGSTKKNILIEEAFVDYKGVENLNVFLGKAPNIFYAVGKQELIWDHDLRPEGMSAGYLLELGEKSKVSFNLGSYWIDAAADDSDQVILNGFQTVAALSVSEMVSFDVGAGVYDYSRMQGHGLLVAGSGFKGNSNVGGTAYAEDYQLIEGFLGMNYAGLKLPVTVFYNHVANIAMSSADQGFIAGVVVGKVKEKGDFGFRYNFRRVEADAVVSAFQDSDFNDGNTNSQGHEIGFDLGIGASSALNLTYFNAKTSASSGGNDYHRGQLDLLFAF